jgi:cytochrome c oxidase cbb3-type subunit III
VKGDVVILTCLVLACEREDRPFSRLSPQRDDTPLDSERRPIASGPRHVTRNAFAVSEGQRLFDWFNCSGCHGGGGGGHIGPALTDAEWRYGSSAEAIHASIADGRPEGMPAFRGKVSEDQLWQLAAYVLALSGRLPQDVNVGRPDGISLGEPPAMHAEKPPRQEKRRR